MVQNNCIFTVTCKTVKNNLETIYFDDFCLFGRLRWFKQAQEKAAIIINTLCFYGISLLSACVLLLNKLCFKDVTDPFSILVT